MTVSVDIWLRGTDFATTASIDDIKNPPGSWTEEDVRVLLGSMLRAMDRLKRPGEADRYIELRGLSWIVNPYDDGGVVVALEITMGAVRTRTLLSITAQLPICYLRCFQFYREAHGEG